LDSYIIEHICRTICIAKGIDPDAEGFAVTESTLNWLGRSYKLWQYQMPVAMAIHSEYLENRND